MQKRWLNYSTVFISFSIFISFSLRIAGEGGLYVAVPGMRKPCVKAVAESLALFLPSSHYLFEARGGNLA